MEKRALFIFLLLIGVQCAAGALTDLSNGFCRSYKFGTTIANDTLYLIDLDGGLIPGDGNASNNYLVQLDLTQQFSLNNGSNYKMSLITPEAPKLKDQALWSSRDNTTLYAYGGRGVDNTSSDNGIWTYKSETKTWKLQQTGMIAVRRLGGAYVNVPAIQGAYWLGGYQSSDTTETITDKTINYLDKMIQLNTTTGQITELSAPSTPVQQGALVYIPVGRMGILVFMGGEVPSAATGVNLTYTPNSWNYVQVYDIASDKWYNQTTSGNVVAARTQFCAVVQHDISSSSYQIYILGGANFVTKSVYSDVSYLSIPSFKWFRAEGLNEGRMTLACEAYGRQIFGVGGRLAWSDTAAAGCYTMPAFLYDAQSESEPADFDPSLFAYSIQSATEQDIKASPYPSTWADPALKTIFTQSSPSPTSSAISSANNGDGPKINVGAMVGGIVGGVAGLASLISVLFFLIRRKRRAADNRPGKMEVKPGCSKDSSRRGELADTELKPELPAQDIPHELGYGNVYEMDGRDR